MRARARVRRVPRMLSLAGVGIVAAGACTDFNTNRTPATRGSLGEEMFGLVCDRLGGQSLHEDLSGASFRNICHRGPDGTFADRVDQSLLSTLQDSRPDVSGKAVPIATQQADRTYGVARLEALARHRADLILAFDAAFPDIKVDVNPACGSAGQSSLHAELAGLLGRLGSLYDDRTISQSTESLAAVVDAFNASPDARAAWARLDARGGYRPIELGYGAARPAIGYPQLRDFTNAALKLLSSDSDPYGLAAQHDSGGARIPIPGMVHAQLSKLLEVARAELANATVDVTTALSAPVDPKIPRTVLSRPRKDLEFLQTVISAQDPAYGSGAPHYIAQRDSRGFVVVPLVNGMLPAPFKNDSQDPTLPAVDGLGQFLMTTGGPAPSPFFAIGSQDAVARDAFGRALPAKGGQPIYGSIDTSHTYLASLVGHLKPLLYPDPAHMHETLMDEAAGAYVLLGTHDGAPTTSYRYADGTVVQFNAFHADASPIADFVYALGQILADPTADETLAFASALTAQHPNVVARIAGDALYARGLAVKDQTARIPPTSTLWDEIIDVTVQIAKEPGLLEDVLRAFADDATVGLGKSLAANAADLDVMSYDRNDLNGPVVNLTTKDGSPPRTPVNRATPDTGANRSELQRFVQIIHDTNGVAMCNKEGAILHARGVLTYALNGDACGSSGAGAGNAGTICTADNNCCPTKCPVGVPVCANARPFKECEVFKIDNLAKFYLDSIVGKAVLYFRPQLLRDGLCVGTTPPPACAGATTVGVIEESSGIGYTPVTAGASTPTTPSDAYNDADPDKPGFWDPVATDSYTNAAKYGYGFRPKPSWLSRQVDFDLANDSPQSGGQNYPTNHFLADMQGTQIGTAVCPERVIPDPCNNDAKCAPAPPAGSPSTFANSTSGVAPDGMVHGLRSCQDGDWFHQREGDVLFFNETNDFFKAITPLATAFSSHNREDLFLALMEVLYKHWQTSKGTASECKLGMDSKGNPIKCTQDGADSYEPLLSQIFSTDLLAAVNELTKVAQGMTVPTCDAVDAKSHLCTRSTSKDGIAILADSTRALVDPDRAGSQHLVDSHGATTSKRNDGTTNPQVTPLYLVLQTLDEIDRSFAAYATANPQDAGRQDQWRRARSQLVDELLSVNGENSPTQTFADPALAKILPVLVDTLRAQLVANCAADPAGQCKWARAQLYQKFKDMIGTRPLFSAIIDLNEGMRQDAGGRAQTEALLTYLLSDAGAVQDILTSGNDLLQVLGDDASLVPLYHVLASALQTSTDPRGRTVRNVVDATTALLSRMAGRAYDANGSEVCGAEVDPSAVLNVALARLVTPMKDANGNPSQTPLEFIIDAIADVSRASPGATGSSGGLPLKLNDSDYANISNELSAFLLDDQRGLEQLYEIVRQGTTHR